VGLIDVVIVVLLNLTSTLPSSWASAG